MQMKGRLSFESVELSFEGVREIGNFVIRGLSAEINAKKMMSRVSI